MKNCAATQRVLLIGSQSLLSMSAEDCTAHRDSLLALSLAFAHASEGLVVAKETLDDG
jgi:hypothetical protein